MTSFNHKGKEITIVEVLRNKMYKVYLNSIYYNSYTSEQEAVKMAIHKIDNGL